MKIKKLVVPMGVAAVAIGIAASTVVPASAVDNIKPFGQQARLNDWATGAPIIGFTVSDLTPSSDPVPHNGQLYEAPLTVDSMGGGAPPVMATFNARAQSGANYPALGSGGPGPMPPGGNWTGKLYFDVVGDQPNSVVYRDAVRDLIAWVPGPPLGGTNP